MSQSCCRPLLAALVLVSAAALPGAAFAQARFDGAVTERDYADLRWRPVISFFSVSSVTAMS